MIQEFKELTEEEVDFMLRVPALICTLVAGADSNIDNSEIRESIAISKLKQTRARKALIEYYRAVGKNFESQFKELNDSYPKKADERNLLITAELEKVNPILKKLDRSYSIKFYNSIKDLANKIAESSGGVLGFMSVSYEESKVIKLDMIKDPQRY